jgi:hypothetical protein
VDCTAASGTLAASIGAGSACTSLVRVDYTTLAPLGWQVWCGDAKATDEKTAQALLAPELPAEPPLDHYVTVSSGPANPWLLFASPGDFGGLGIVSARTGALVFAGSIEWMGSGEITYPATWRSPTDLGRGCAPSPRPELRGWRYVEMNDDRAKALDVVWSTALPGAVTKSEVPLAFVVGYARSVGLLDPRSAEWLVVIESNRE